MVNTENWDSIKIINKTWIPNFVKIIVYYKDYIQRDNGLISIPK